MPDSYPRTYARDGFRPRPVDNGYIHDIPRNPTRQHKDSEERSHRRAKRDASHRSSKKESSHRRKPTTSHMKNEMFEKPPSFELDVIGQPPQGIMLGMSVDASVLISISRSSVDRMYQVENIDTSQLFAVVSLVAEDRDGDRIPMEGSILGAQNLFSSVHALPTHYAESLANSQPQRLAVGYFSFPGLVIRQSGTYRIRTTLGQMGHAGAEYLFAVDSEIIRVERRNTATPRRHQVICC